MIGDFLCPFKGEKVKRFVISIFLIPFLVAACSQPKNLDITKQATYTPTADILPIPSIATTFSKEEAYPHQAYWWNRSVFYEVFVRSFSDSDGDGTGDIQGLIQRLDYLNDGNRATTQDLGITALWLMPIFPAASYHGYDVIDYLNINPEYGTLNDFKHLLKEAHSRGIRIILDLVINHTSDQHPWFKAALDPNSIYHDYYIWSENDPGYLGPSNQHVWHLASNGLYYYGVFNASMPDLNYRNPAVTREIRSIIEFWLSNIGVDGFRIDGARHLIEEGEKQINTQATHEWFKEFRNYYKSLNPEAVTVGEIWDHSSSIAAYVGGDELDLAFDFELADAMVKSAAERSSFLVNTILSNDLPLFQNGSAMATFLSNHDMNRSYNSFGNIVDKAKNAATILLTSPGIPFIYYGEEIGMTGVKPDEMIRTPMQWNNGINSGFSSSTPWEPVNLDFTTINVESEERDPESLLSWYKKMIGIRVSNLLLQTGDYYAGSFTDNSVFISLRSDEAEGILTIVNLTNKDIPGASFSLNGSSLFGSFIPIDLVTGKEYPTLVINKDGGFEKYVPATILPANARLVLYLGPEQ